MPTKRDQKLKQQAYDQAMQQALIDSLLNQSEIFRRQLPQLKACFPGWRINAVREVK